MGVGTASQEWQDERSPRAMFAAVVSAMEAVGKVKETDEPAGFVRGTTRYGLQRVRVKIHIIPGRGGGSSISAEALADDIWGVGARKGISKLREALA